MTSADVEIELSLGKEASETVCLAVGFKVTHSGCPAHMGDFNYPGHPAEPMEIEITTIFWPTKRWDKEAKTFKDDHIEFPASGLPDAVYEAVIEYICENYEPETGESQ